MNIQNKGLTGVAISALLMAGQASAESITVKVTGQFTDYRFIGVGVTLTDRDGSDPSTWDSGPLQFDIVSGEIVIEGGIVTSAILTAGPVIQTYTSTGGVNPTEGNFTGLVYAYNGGPNLVQAPGTGSGVEGTCTPLGAAVNVACTDALAAWQNEGNSRLTNWNGIPEGATVNDLFGGSGILNFALAAQDGANWTVGGLDVGDSISAQLFRWEPNENPFFNAAFAGQLQLTVVPVPAAVWLFASGLALIGFLRRRAVS